ncbi:MAG TPA: leucyl aminopeptidase [Solirubrobacteraceae bacterium]|nr:leucyl aminopeptidase [Solirubrobacteraceae bacterium]
MEVEATTEAPSDTGADTICVGVFEGEDVAHDVDGATLQGLLDSGEARRAFKKLAVAHAAGRRWLLVGLGKRDNFDPERARVAAAVAHDRARELGSKTICWELPHHVSDGVCGGLVEGNVLAAYRFERYKKTDPDEDGTGPQRLIVSAHDDVSAPVASAAIVADAQNAARDLQNAPANDLTPTRLAERAQAIADELEGVEVELLGRAEIIERGMGAFAAVAQGTYEEPQLITLRYDGPDAAGPTLGFVGKAVTFDSGGISIKPSAKMAEMKFDMSGGAAVIEALAAIARLRLPVRVLSVVGATENMPSGRSIKPGDIVRAADGTSIEVNNTDAEGRLVLADCLLHAIAAGAERLVDLATLTGAIIVALGSTHAGLFSADDTWAEQVAGAGEASGETVWRLPLHPEYDELIKGRYGDIVNAPEARKAMSSVAAEFLRRFTGEVPWAHLDIAGTAWDVGRPYAAKGGSGFGVRLLVELARSVSASAAR